MPPGPSKRPADVRRKDFREIYEPLTPQMAMELAQRCINCPEALCQGRCPLHNRIPEWMLLTAEGRFYEAAAVASSTSNMPEICGRVCPQDRLCEGACILTGKQVFPVSIGAIERFLLDYAFDHGLVRAVPVKPNGFRVAVIGSGPAGLACADELAKRGYSVTVFEACQLPGGLLMNGIPAFKLEKWVVERRVKLIEQRGVKFCCGIRVGEDISLAELYRQYDAIFIGIGTWRPKGMDLPGVGLLGVYPALPFLIQKNSHEPLNIEPIDVAGKQVVVLGGGDTAMDCLRTAIRCGAKRALCIYRRDESNMPGSRREYKNALEEGAEFIFLTNPIKIVGDELGRVKAVRCVKMELGQPDASGRRRPEPVPGSEHDIAADVVLIAFGFDPVPLPQADLFEKLTLTHWGTIQVDQWGQTNIKGIFAGGDIVTGPALVVEAVAAGRRAAAGIHQYLMSRCSKSPLRTTEAGIGETA